TSTGRAVVSQPRPAGATQRETRAQSRARSLARDAVDLRPRLMSPVSDQGDRPLCLPLSATAAHEASRGGVGAARRLAPEALWWHCVGVGAAGPEGALLADVGHALRGVGQPACE